MKAAYVEGFCAASGSRYGELPDPAPGPGQVLVRVEAVAVNKVDTLVRSGTWRTPVAFPLVVGRDLAGTVVVGGPGADDVHPGDRVWANSAGYGGRPGATAELVLVERARLYRLAPVMRFADAARAHSIVESGQLPRLADHTIGRLTLQP